MFEKIVLVTRKTRLAELVERLNTRAQARFYLEHAGQDFEDYAREDDTYRRALDGLRGALSLGLPVQQVDRSLVPTFLFTRQGGGGGGGAGRAGGQRGQVRGRPAAGGHQPGPRALRWRAAALRRDGRARGGAPDAGGQARACAR